MRNKANDWLGWASGDTGSEVINIKNWLRPRYEKAGSKQLNGSNLFDPVLADVVRKLRKNVGLPPVDVDGTPRDDVWDWKLQGKLNYRPGAAPSPQVCHCAIIPGTWAGPQDGPPSWVMDWVDKTRFKRLDIAYLARGFLNPDPNTSYEESLTDGIEKTVAAILRTPGPIVLIGYSQGADVAVHVMHEFVGSGRLASRVKDLKRVIAFGNPGRPPGPDFMGKVFPQAGISGVYPPAELAHLLHSYDFPQDMYANANAIMRQFYKILTKMELSVDFAMACLQLIGGVIPLFGTNGSVLGNSVLGGLFGKIGSLTKRVEAIAPNATQQEQLSIASILSDLPGVAFALQQLMGFMSTNAHGRYGGSESWLDYEGTDAVRHAARGLNAMKL